MGLIRKTLWVGTGGVSGLFIHANSKKERTANALERMDRREPRAARPRRL